jgi:hypothetical protein
MVPRTENSSPIPNLKSEAPGDVVWRATGSEMNDANDVVPRHGYDDWEREEKRDSEDSMDELESSLSGLSSDGSEGKGTKWEERLKWWKVYALHFLFAWNSRTFEYVSVGHSEYVYLD